MKDRIATDAWSILGSDNSHRYPVVSPKQVRNLLDYAKETAENAAEVRDCLSSVLLDMNAVVASLKWQVKDLRAENEALRKALKHLT